MKRVARGAFAASVMLGIGLFAGCSGGGGEADGASGGAADSLGPDVIADAEPATITWCAQKDSSGSFTPIVDGFNEEFGGDGFKLELLEFPENTDEWRNQFVQRQEARSDECDIFSSDVVWTAEFATKNYLYDLTPYVAERADSFIPSTLSTTEYDGKNWGVPFGTNVGFLFFRTDRLAQAPASWQEAYAEALEHGGIVYQASAYEGLTVNFLELASAAGGTVLSEDGSRSAINSPENLAALQLMVDGINDGAAPRDVLTYTEEETRRAFESGNAGLARNWTYQYVLGRQNPEIADKFDMIPFPLFEGGIGKGSGILGGINMVVSRFSENPEAALKAIDYITSQESQTAAILAGGQPSTLTAVYDVPEVREALPFADTLRTGVEQAVSRPVTPVYSLVSQALYTNINKALAGNLTPEEALEQADADINEALAAY